MVIAIIRKFRIEVILVNGFRGLFSCLGSHGLGGYCVIELRGQFELRNNWLVWGET